MLFGRGIALAALALSLTLVFAAQAAGTAAFHTEEEGALLTGGYPTEKETPSEEEAITFRFKSKVPCLTASFSGATPPTTTTETITLTPTLGTCIAISLTTGACDFVLTAEGDLKIENGVSCSLEPIEVQTQTTCKVQVPPQVLTSSVTYANHGAGSERHVTATIAATGLHYTQLNSLCSGGKGTFNSGELTGQITIRADQLETETQQGLWHE